MSKPEEKSRYGDKIATKLVGAAENSIVDPARVPDEIARIRNTFNSDKTLSKEWRVGQLKALLRMMEEGRKELQEAEYKDLHKSAHECDLTEIDLTIGEIHYALINIDDWMAPHPASLSVANQPGSGATVFDPLGVVLVMGAWNYPVLLTISPIIGAIAAGNCVAVKPGSYAPYTSHAIAKLLSRYMDSDCFAICEGNRDVTDALLKEKFNCIFFTGSGFVGKLVAKAAAANLCPVVLELGGKSPVIVDETANLELAAERVVWGTFLNSGQTCIRPDHCYVHESIADKFLSLCKEKIVQMFSSDIQKAEQFGRIINDAAFKRLKEIIEKCRPHIFTGGKTDASDKFIEPTLIDYKLDGKAFDESAAMEDELFGPVLPILRYRDLEQDVIRRIRNLPTGKPLALYLFSDNSKTIENVTRRTTSGGMCINDCLMHIANHDLPFGGVGESGMGSYHGFRSFKCFSHEKAVLTKYSFLDANPLLAKVLSVRYPPFTDAKKKAAKGATNPALETIRHMLNKSYVKQIFLVLLLLIIKSKLGYKLVRE